jgi:hypothetical protein
MAKAAKKKSAKVARLPASKKPASKKAPAKKAPAKKAAAKKPAAKKPAAKKPAAKKAAAKKPAAKKPAAKMAAPRKLAAPRPPAAQAAPAVPGTIDAFKPFVLMAPNEHSTKWSLFLADAHSPVDLFEEEGHSGNGYAWDSVARVAMTTFPDHRDAIEFNSEAGTFVAESEEKAALIALGAALLRLLENEAELRTVIRSVPEDDWDD